MRICACVALLLASIAGHARPETPPPVQPAQSEAPSTLGTESINELLRRTMDDPRTAARRRQMLKTSVKQTYSDFAEAQHLPPAQTEELFELLTDKEMIDLQDGTAFLAGDPDDANAPDSIAQLAIAAWAAVDRRLETLLPRDQFARFQEYEKTVSERVALAELRQELAMMSQPLSEVQAKFLLQVLRDERLRLPPLAYDPRSPGRYRDKHLSALQGDNGAQYLKAQADMDERVLARAKDVLTADQCEALASFQKQYREVERSGIELARKVTASKSTPSVTP
jgi:hypothetical protein